MVHPLSCMPLFPAATKLPQTANQWVSAWDCQMVGGVSSAGSLSPHSVTGSAPAGRAPTFLFVFQAAAAMGYDTVGLQVLYAGALGNNLRLAHAARPTFPLQFGGQCYGGFNPQFKALGNATACFLSTSPLGGSYTNQVFQLMPRGCSPSCSWSYKGCFVDSSTKRQIPTQLAAGSTSVSSAQDCMRLAALSGYDTVRASDVAGLL